MTAAETVHPGIAVARPRELAIDSSTGRLYVVGGNPTNGVNTIDVFDQGQPVAHLLFADFIDEISVNPVTHRVYFAKHESYALGVLDGLTATTIATIPLPGMPGSVAVNPATNEVYVSHYDINPSRWGISVIDGVTNAITHEIATYFSGPMEVDPVLNKVFVLQGDVLVIDGATHESERTIVVEEAKGAWAIAVDPSTHLLYIGQGQRVTAVDAVTWTRVPFNVVYLRSQGSALAIHPASQRLYVVMWDEILAEQLFAVVMEQFPVPQAGYGAHGLALDHARHTGYVVSFDRNVVVPFSWPV